MSDDTPNLSLPLIQPAQAQKHITHNEALERLDALVQLSVEALDATAPPASPAEGQVWAVGTGAAGAWAGQDGTLALFTNGAFLHLPLRAGLRAWDRAASGLFVWDGGGWTSVGGGLAGSVPGLGINAAYDADNRLAVASPGTLLNHAGAGHRLKINKEDPGDTASLLYQTGFSGRAEMGLAGDDDFAVKVSANGTDWRQAFRVEGASGDTAFGRISAAALTGTAVQQAPDDTGEGRLMRADYGYGPGNLLGPVSQSAGLPTGAVIERGETADGRYVRFADGTQICTTRGLDFTASGATEALRQWSYPAPFAALPDSVTATLSLDAADWSDPASRARVSVLGLAGAQSATEARLVLYFTESRTVSIANCRAMAVGRWV